MSPSGLGRGLGSLIPKKIQEEIKKELPNASQNLALEIQVEEIVVNPRQPRQHFSSRELEDLIASIKEHGILQPLIVTRARNGYELIAGERRYRAASALGLKTVPAIVRSANEQEKLEIALIENLQRQNLNAIEEAYAFKALHDEFNLTHEQVALRVGKSRSQITNTIRLLELDDDIQDALREGKITQSHARTLLAESDSSKRRKLFAQMLSGGVSVREAEARVAPSARARLSQARDPQVVETEKKLRELLGTKVSISERNGVGKLVIEFYSKSELFSILDKLTD
ncbi:MAG: hypothetical protein ACD_76C00094G0044 [uncultured bacterium]|nr:MAG: hypothetical protein ACD_76C00094G0044 [uncultured bacterium]HBD04906.1 chromosome partitioning protein ParB [Candidatus Uhrbacteria bacterium]